MSPFVVSVTGAQSLRRIPAPAEGHEGLATKSRRSRRNCGFVVFVANVVALFVARLFLTLSDQRGEEIGSGQTAHAVLDEVARAPHYHLVDERDLQAVPRK
jgi:hypothetical protein